jgi:hypothetical protein
MCVWTKLFSAPEDFVDAVHVAQDALGDVLAADDVGVELAALALLVKSIAGRGVSHDVVQGLCEEALEHEHF